MEKELFLLSLIKKKREKGVRRGIKVGVVCVECPFCCVVYGWLASSKVEELGSGVCTLLMMMS